MTPSNPRLALGVALDNQRVGFAVLDQECLHAFAVADIWKGERTPDGRLGYFVRALERRLSVYRPTHIAIANPVLPSALVDRCRDELEEAARRLGGKLTAYGRLELKRSSASGGRRYTDLMARIALRHPELRQRFRVRQEIPGYRGIASAHERYNRQLFLAVAAAEQALADDLVHEVPEPPSVQAYEESQPHVPRL